MLHIALQAAWNAVILLALLLIIFMMKACRYTECCFALQDSLETLVNDHNSQLTSAVADFNTSNEGTQVAVYDISTLFSAVLATPANYANPVAFTNTTGACRVGDLDTVQAAGFSTPNCPDGDAYVFWDIVSSTHPSLSYQRICSLGTLGAYHPCIISAHLQYFCKRLHM